MTGRPSWNQTCRTTWPGWPPSTRVQKETRVPAGNRSACPTSRPEASPVPTPCSETSSASVGGAVASTAFLAVRDASGPSPGEPRPQERLAPRTGGEVTVLGARVRVRTHPRVPRIAIATTGDARCPGGEEGRALPRLRLLQQTGELLERPPFVLGRAEAPLPLPGAVVLQNRLGIDAEQLRVGPDVALAERPGGQGLDVALLQRLQVMTRDPRRVGHGIERQSAGLARPSQQLPEGASRRESGPVPWRDVVGAHVSSLHPGCDRSKEVDRAGPGDPSRRPANAPTARSPWCRPARSRP